MKLKYDRHYLVTTDSIYDLSIMKWTIGGWQWPDLHPRKAKYVQSDLSVRIEVIKEVDDSVLKKLKGLSG